MMSADRFEAHASCRIEARRMSSREIVYGISRDAQPRSFPVKHYLFEKEKSRWEVLESI